MLCAALNCTNRYSKDSSLQFFSVSTFETFSDKQGSMSKRDF
uniref:THAP-type domain-containing protein n=1 Tax=Anguilla anguilla TaxID=7936 RepID=A0A0E9VAP9_ANGAN